MRYTFYTLSILFIMILSSCLREPIDTIISLKGVKKITFISLQDGKNKIVKSEISDEDEINYFLNSFYSKNESRITINEKDFIKDAEIDISFSDNSTLLTIDIDTKMGYKITLGSKVYYEAFTWLTGQYTWGALQQQIK